MRGAGFDFAVDEDDLMMYAAIATGHGEHLIRNQVALKAILELQTKGFINEKAFVFKVKAIHYALGLVALIYEIWKKKATVTII